jgi:hypothetical protein
VLPAPLFPVTTVSRPGSSPADPPPASRPSVVIASCRHLDLLWRLVASIEVECAELGAELVIARAGTPEELAIIRRRLPRAVVVEAPPGCGIPRLRGLGLAAAHGDPVLLTEDHCVAGPGWIHALVERIAGGADVVGGGMANAPTSGAVAWAAYLADYGFYSHARPLESRHPPLLTAANIAYARRVVADVADWSLQGAWENVAHDRLGQQGAVLQFAPTARVFHDHEYRLGRFWLDRYEHGWDYARARLTEEGSQRRWLHLLVTPFLPLVLLRRIARAAGGENRAAFQRALPATVFLLYGWAAGEAIGYLRGPLGVGEEAGRVRVS